MRAWRTAFGSATGTAHARIGTACQDAGCCAVLAAPDGGEVLVASICDGAGSAAQSEHGAHLVMQSFQARFTAAAQDDASLQTIDRRFVLGWLAEIQEAIRIRASADGCHSRDYACTLLGAVIGSHCAIFVQIGDGAIVVTAGDDPPHWIFWPQHGEFANSTFFVTMPDAAEIIQVKRHDNSPVCELAMFSDGLERLILDMAARTVHAPALRPILGWLAATDPAPGGQQSEIVAAFLNSPNVNRRTDDDKTLVIATRMAPPEPP